MYQIITVLAISGDMILTDNYRFLLGDVDSNQLTDMETGEVLTVEGCTTDINGKLESLSVS